MNRITRSGRTALQIAVCFALLLAFAVAANAQTFVTVNTTTTLWGGSQDTTTFGFSAYTAPFPGVILTGTAISTITGKPVRHLWYGDPLNGFCRIDPEVDAVIPPVAGLGQHNPVIQSCLASIQAKGITPGQVAYDAVNNFLYFPDTSRTNAGFLRAVYIPSGDNGQGSVDIVRVTSLIGTQAGRNAFGGCPQLKDPKTGSLVPVVPNSAALGPDGNLYGGSIRDGAVIRIIGPDTFDPNVNCPDPNKLNQPGDRIQIPLLSSDEKFGSGHTFGLGFIGTTLFGADNIAPWILTNATQCLTPINGNKMCASPALGGQAQMPIEILAAQVAGPQAGLISDAQLGKFPGSVIYAATFPNVTRVTNILTATSMTVNQNYGGNFNFITGLAADPQDINNAIVYVGSDPTQGGINGSGQIWQVTPLAPAPGPPATPVVTSAVAGPGTGQATVTWSPVINGQPITTYVVQTLLASLTGGAPTPSTVPNVTVTAPTTSAVISGLTVGTAYVFEVQACNLTGCSGFSAPSSIITAFAVTVPPAPTSVLGVAVGNGTSAAVSWTQSGNGNSPITSSTILTADAAGVVVPNTVILGSATGGTVNGLTCGVSYTFSVFATNAVGNSATSAPSLPVSIPCVTSADVSLTMSSPATINAGSILTYSMTVHNGGPASAAQVLISDTLPAPFVSATTSQGVCAGAVGVTTMSCNLGSMAAGATATVSVSVQLPTTGTQTSFTNTATVSATDATGVNVDPNLANNTASSTTTISAPTASCTTSTTDIQVGGAAQNGNPTHGTPDVFTWQIKNNLGTVTANCVTFNVTTTAPTGAVLAVNSTNPGPGTTAPFCTINAAGTGVSCTIGSIAGGQTAIVTVTATPSAAAPANSYSMTGNAQLGTGSTDTNPANNSFTVFIGAQ